MDTITHDVQLLHIMCAVFYCSSVDCMYCRVSAELRYW